MPFGSWPAYCNLKNSVFCARWTSRVQGFESPKRFYEEKVCVFSSIPKSTVYNSRTADGRYIFFENIKAKERTRFAPLSQTECSKIWMCKS